MPPRSRNRSGDTYIIQTEDLHLCSNFLTSEYWKMAKELNKEQICPICMIDLIDPPQTEMSRGFALLVCGHSQCLGTDPKAKIQSGIGKGLAEPLMWLPIQAGKEDIFDQHKLMGDASRMRWWHGGIPAAKGVAWTRVRPHAVRVRRILLF